MPQVNEMPWVMLSFYLSVLMFFFTIILQFSPPSSILQDPFKKGLMFFSTNF